MKPLKYIKELSKKTIEWYNILKISETGTIPPKEEWAKHFNVSIGLYEHVQLEMNK